MEHPHHAVARSAEGRRPMIYPDRDTILFVGLFILAMECFERMPGKVALQAMKHTIISLVLTAMIYTLLLNIILP
jgi:hypothetical protein